MANATAHYFTGPCKWAKVYKPDEKFNKYSIDVLLDMDQFTALKALKVKNNGKPGAVGTAEDGKMWVVFRRKGEDGPPTVVDAQGMPFTESIGNGSEVTVKFEVESFISKKWGTVVRSSLLSVMVNKYVKYDPDAASPAVESVGVKPRLMF